MDDSLRRRWTSIPARREQLHLGLTKTSDPKKIQDYFNRYQRVTCYEGRWAQTHGPHPRRGIGKLKISRAVASLTYSPAAHRWPTLALPATVSRPGPERAFAG